jgi:hypothetical protein
VEKKSKAGKSSTTFYNFISEAGVKKLKEYFEKSSPIIENVNAMCRGGVFPVGFNLWQPFKEEQA